MMILYQEHNLIEDKKAIRNLNLASLVLFLVFWVLGVVYETFGPHVYQRNYFWDFIVALAVFVPLVVLHELIHGLFFKAFQPEAKVRFGFKNGMAYATSPGTLYTPGQFAWISAAPFVILSTIGFVCLTFFPFHWLMLVLVIHASACTGDFYWLYLIAISPKNTLIEDTDKGMTIWLKN